MKEKIPSHIEIIKGKWGRFEYTVRKEFYNGEEEREAQIKALKILKNVVVENE